MFDCDISKFIPIDDEFCNAMCKCFKIIVKAHCSLCGVEISTRWVACKIDGNFMAMESVMSEIWGEWLPSIETIVCHKCFSGS